MKFVQIIEFKTSRLEEFSAIFDDWLAKTEGRRTAARAIQTRDRDQDGVYLHIVEFPSYEQAMENSNRPETAEFAHRLAQLCDGPPVFRNLDVLAEDGLRS
jgi:quinol monooxygenase YgiN